MKDMLQRHTGLDRSKLLLGWLLTGLLLTGCGEKSPHLDARVTTPVGRPGVCAHCNEKIDRVTQEQVIAVDGVQHVVCNEECEQGLRKWLAEQ